MAWVTTSSIVVTAAAVALTFAVRRRDPEPFIMGLTTGWCWLVCHALRLEVGAEFRRIYPITDLGLALLALSMIWSEAGMRVDRAALWKTTVFAILTIQLCLHPLFPTWLPLEQRKPYLAALNVGYWLICGALVAQALRSFTWRFRTLAPAS